MTLPIQLTRPLLRSRYPIIIIPKVTSNYRHVLRVWRTELEALKVVQFLVSRLQVAIAGVMRLDKLFDLAPVSACPRLAIAWTEAVVIGVERDVAECVVSRAHCICAKAIYAVQDVSVVDCLRLVSTILLDRNVDVALGW